MNTGGLRSANDEETEDDARVRLNGQEVHVLFLDAMKTFAVTMGLLKFVDVEKREFPSSGVLYLYQDSVDDEKYLREAHRTVADAAKEEGMKIPPLKHITHFDGLVRFCCQYEMRRMNGKWFAVIKTVEPLETPYELTEDNELVPFGEGPDEPIEQKRTHWQDFIIPIPPPAKNAPDELYLTLAYEFYDAIKAGTKTTEYRDYTPNWVKRTLSHPIRTVKFQRGYGGPGHPPPEQMIWTVKGVWLYESATKTKGDPSNPPQGIIPDCIAIDLGCRVG